jgi:cob(I)alamin adenosyltransferase
MKIYTRRGDDGTTGLLYGGRVPKDSPAIEANGAVDEAQAALGLARARPMVDQLEGLIDELTGRFPAVTEFVVPGHDRLAAALDLARTLIRRAERRTLRATPEGSRAGVYLNRLSDLVWTMARWQEQGESLPSRRRSPR